MGIIITCLKEQGILFLLSPFSFGTYFKELIKDLRRIFRKVCQRPKIKVTKFSVQLNTKLR